MTEAGPAVSRPTPQSNRTGAVHSIKFQLPRPWLRPAPRVWEASFFSQARDCHKRVDDGPAFKARITFHAAIFSVYSRTRVDPVNAYLRIDVLLIAPNMKEDPHPAANPGSAAHPGDATTSTLNKSPIAAASVSRRVPSRNAAA